MNPPRPHKYNLGDLVELEDGERLYVCKHVYDESLGFFYELGFKSDIEEWQKGTLTVKDSIWFTREEDMRLIRSSETEKLTAEISKHIDSNNFDEARRILDKLEILLGENVPETVYFQSLISFMED
jgi:hypothetical protein